jgi:putative ABC transport system permease protein
MLQTWLKIFYRNSKKNWLHILINALGLTLGFAGLLIVLLFYSDEQSYDRDNVESPHIYRALHLMQDNEIWETSTNVEGQKYKEDIPEVELVYLSDSWYDAYVIKYGEKQLYTRNMLCGEPEFFKFFPFEIVEGSISEFEKSRSHIAISKKQANLFFGDESALGKTITFDERTYIISTVYKIEGKHFFMPSIVSQYEKQPDGNWGSFSRNLFVKLKAESDIDLVTKKANDVWYKYAVVPQAELDGISPEEFNEKYGTEILFESLKDIRLHTVAQDGGPEGKGSFQLILIMMSLSVLLIIISCVNFINLSVASATQRAKEVGVKKTLGLSKIGIARQYTLEIMFQGLLAFGLSLLLVELLLPYFNEYMRMDISILEPRILLQLLAVVLVVSVIVGTIPGIYLSNFKSVEVLKGNVSRSKKGVMARNIMLGMQFLISGFFLAGSVIIYEQVNYMMDKDLGFEGDQILIIPMNQDKNRHQKYQLAKKELIKHPNIEAVTSNSFIVGGGSSSSTNFDYNDISVQANSNAVDYNYMELMDLEILKGRGFKEEIASDTIKNIVINETLAKAFNIYDDPIGKKVNAGFSSTDNDGKGLNVIGMVKDYHILGLDNKIPPMFIFHWNTFDWMRQNIWMIQVKVKAKNVDQTIAYLENYWKENIEQGYPFSAQFIDKRFARTYAKYERQRTLFFILTAVVVIVSLLGLFALATLTIQQRLKEVAIRKTLGASVQEIMHQLIKGFVKITLIASVVLIPIAYYVMQNWLDNFVYRIDMPLLPFIITPIVLSILVVIVVGLKAYNATKVDLIKYLKFE